MAGAFIGLSLFETKLPGKRASVTARERKKIKRGEKRFSERQRLSAELEDFIERKRGNSPLPNSSRIVVLVDKEEVEPTEKVEAEEEKTATCEEETEDSIQIHADEFTEKELNPNPTDPSSNTS